MPASDPVTDVPTPTGTLQGVAAFSWDGAAWQPTGRAGPSVATPTGVLRGVAAFNGGPAWQPAGLAQPSVATPTGALDGVAVYTWSGSAWTPPGGTATPSTPSGALRGVAAFNWDGAVWQPAGQAGPSVATPYGVLDGVAMFGWTGSAWAAVGAPSLSLSFMAPGALDPRITFTRASTATYFNSAGVMQTAAANAPRWDYNPTTLALNGLLIEEARTNLILQSGNQANAAWTAYGGSVAAPVVTANQTAAPDGTLTAARVVYPSVAIGTSVSIVYQQFTATAASYTFSIYLKGSIGGEQLYLCGNSGGGATYIRNRVTLTTAWQRFILTGTLTAASWPFSIGADLTDPSQTSIAAQTIYMWGAQVELGAFATSYIPTIGAAVARSQDVLTMPATGAWRTAATETWEAEFISIGFAPSASPRILADNVTSSAPLGHYNSLQVFTFDGGTAVNTTNSFVVGAVAKAAAKYGSSVQSVCVNGGAVASSASTGFSALTTLRILSDGAGNNCNGYIRRIIYWPRILSNAEMQQVTT